MTTEGPKHAVGDIVHLNSGGPLLTVTGDHGDNIHVMWFDGMVLQRGSTIPAAALCPFSTEVEQKQGEGDKPRDTAPPDATGDATHDTAHDGWCDAVNNFPFDTNPVASATDTTEGDKTTEQLVASALCQLDLAWSTFAIMEALAPGRLLNATILNLRRAQLGLGGSL